MLTKNQIKTIYINAREMVRANQPKVARAYVLILLNNALESYKNKATTILSKAKTEIFMDRWIAVSRELYEKGITPFVLESFNLTSSDKDLSGKTASPRKRDKPKKDGFAAGGEEIEFAGLIEEAQKTQGWGADVFGKNKASVAEIYVVGNGQTASGTGFIISKNGYLLTNDHVVFDEVNGVYFPKVFMKLCGAEKKIKLEVLFSDKRADVALCKFNADEVGECESVKRIADYSAVSQGADCLVIGNGFCMGLAPLLGEVRYTKDGDGNLVHTAPSNPGDSGGPVFNRKGECIGINKSRTVSVNEEAAEGYANATPMDTIEKLLEKWTKNNDIIL